VTCKTEATVRVSRRSVGTARLPFSAAPQPARQHPHRMSPSYSVSHPVGAAHRALCGAQQRGCMRCCGIKGLIRIRCGRLVIAWNAPAGLHTPHRTRSYVPCEHAARAWCKRSHAEGPLWCVPSPTGKSHHAGRLLAAEHSSGALVPFCDSSCRQHCTGRGSYR
jgi:hypothetical protein